MNIYLVGIVVAMVIFITIGVYVGRKIKDTNDYYVAGRRAPVILIVGSLIASFLSTGAFMGDVGEVYSGFFMGIVIVGVLQSVGYGYGATLFGRYIRRSAANTVPEYFGMRFSSLRMQRLAAVTLMFGVTAYLLSAMQGVSTLMASVTNIEYKICVILAWLSFTVFTVYSGSKGVLITDTIMFLIFLVAALIGIPYVVGEAGGWMEAIKELARSETCPGIIAWTNNLCYLYPTGMENLIWAITYGIVWALVVMVSPWQTSRYLMAKDEHTVLRSAVWASIGVAVVTLSLYFAAVFIYKINPNIKDASTCLIWAAMNIMPSLVGVVLLTGILSAGISSASTFLSLIGNSLTNDLFTNTRNLEKETALRVSRYGMALVSVIVLGMSYFNPPQIFWIMYFGGTVIASSWGVVAIVSVWWKDMSEQGAFLGMLLGFFGCVVPMSLGAFGVLKLPFYLDPFIIGMVMSVMGMIFGSKFYPATDKVRKQYIVLHAASSDDSHKDKVTHSLMYVYVVFGGLLSLFFIFMYAIPYMKAIG